VTSPRIYASFSFTADQPQPSLVGCSFNGLQSLSQKCEQNWPYFVYKCVYNAHTRPVLYLDGQVNNRCGFLKQTYASFGVNRHKNSSPQCEISGSHGGEYEWIYEQTDALMMDAVSTSETSIYSDETTRRYILEGFNLRFTASFQAF
jgi:hypothetical protein